MKIFARFSLLAMISVVLSTGLGGAKSAFAVDFTFTRTLSVGASGEDVRQLQKILNSDPITCIQGAGPGSPGQETAYFGALTRDAVIRFQEKYSQEVLVPNGLSAGTGFVGPSTLAVLAHKSQSTPVSVTNPVLPVSAPNMAVSTSVANPNLKNVDKFLAAIDRVSVRQNIPVTKVASIKDAILKEVATTTDLKKTFIDLVNKNGKKASNVSSSAFEDILAKVGTVFSRIFGPEQAVAAGNTPFGGALLFSFECTCSYNWLIMVEPLPPSYVALLTYTPFSQVYMGHNIPETEWLLGKYSKGEPCEEYVPPDECIEIPSEGMISPQTGSSGL